MITRISGVQLDALFCIFFGIPGLTSWVQNNNNIITMLKLHGMPVGKNRTMHSLRLREPIHRRTAAGVQA